MDAPTTFWDDLARDLEDPEFLREYVIESIRIATIDNIVNGLDEARIAAELTKANLARAINSNPATIRRLFSGSASNPTLGTLAEVAAALGMRVKLEPFPDSERSTIAQALLEGSAANIAELATSLGSLRGPTRALPVA